VVKPDQTNQRPITQVHASVTHIAYIAGEL